jgi:UDP-glucose 4-epimerase
MEDKANILIIGGAGYIGSHIAVEHLNRNHNVIIVDNLSSSEEFIVDNIKEISKYPEIQGVLVGGASLKLNSFVKICKSILE